VILSRWSAQPKASAQEVAKILTEEYVRSYNAGPNGIRDATFATYNLSSIPHLLMAVKKLGTDFLKLGTKSKAKLLQLVQNTQNFSYVDYVDLSDFVSHLEKEHLEEVAKSGLGDLQNAISELVIAHAETPNYSRAAGVSIWLPTSKDAYQTYAKTYEDLKFNSVTHWGSVLGSLLKGR
jgi:hypothetical protein